MKRRQTHARVDKELLQEMKSGYPNMSFNQIVKLSWNNQKRIEQTLDRLLNGKDKKK